VKQNGRVILNGNDDKLRAVEDVHGIRPAFYGVDSSLEGSQDLGAGARMEYPGGLAEDQCVRITQIQLRGFEGSECSLHTPAGDITVKVPVPGIHNASNAAAAAAVGLACGMTLDEIRRGIESAQTISGRFRVLKTDRMTVIDDCYNANPVSMKSSVAVLEQGSGRRVAVLGDMGELGEDEVKLHEGVGTYAAGRVDHLIAVGELAKSLYEAALKERPDLSASWYATVEEFLAHKDEELKDGDSVLVKASHFMQFSKIVEELTA
jgi:UDP-N-acetylmuramoyl-tripeptide--D-alanyl-D-alanine ligase